jgi:hypothetical protein
MIKASVANYVPIDCPVPNPERNAERRKRERHPKVDRLTITGRRTSAAATRWQKMITCCDKVTSDGKIRVSAYNRFTVAPFSGTP